MARSNKHIILLAAFKMIQKKELNKTNEGY